MVLQYNNAIIQFYNNTSIERGEMGKIISLVNPKGGSGKSTLTLCLAEVFENSMIIDFDPQACLWSWYQERIANKCDKHNHSIDKSSCEISSILYFDNGKLGTNLYIKNNCIELPEEKNKWFFFSSKIDHAPKEGLVKKDRLVLATSVGLCLEN